MDSKFEKQSLSDFNKESVLTPDQRSMLILEKFERSMKYLQVRRMQETIAVQQQKKSMTF